MEINVKWKKDLKPWDLLLLDIVSKAQLMTYQQLKEFDGIGAEMTRDRRTALFKGGKTEGVKESVGSS